MATQFSSGKFAIAECGRCAKRTKLKDLKELVVKLKPTGLFVCKSCFDPDHPQLQLGMYPVNDPQAVRKPWPDVSYAQSGLLTNGSYGEGSRVTQWGWNPIGGGTYPNALTAQGRVGTVSVSTQ